MIFCIYLICFKLQNSVIWPDLSLRSMLVVLVLKNGVECTSQHLKRMFGGLVLIIFHALFICQVLVTFEICVLFSFHVFFSLPTDCVHLCDKNGCAGRPDVSLCIVLQRKGWFDKRKREDDGSFRLPYLRLT